MEAVQERLIWLGEMTVVERFEGVDGGVVSVVGGGVFETVTETGVEVLVFPAASLATAVRDLAPLDVWVVFQEYEYGEEVSSGPRLTPSSLNWTPTTPTLSVAVAVKLTVPERVELLVGAVRETVGAVVSGGAWVVMVAMEE